MLCYLAKSRLLYFPIYLGDVGQFSELKFGQKRQVFSLWLAAEFEMSAVWTYSSVQDEES